MLAMRFARRFGAYITLIGLSIALISFLFALPGLQIGIWRETEGVTAALHAASGLAAVGLALAAAAGERSSARLARHPFVLIPLAMALWSALMSVAVASPMASLFGNMELGQGILWYLELALLTLAASWLWQLPAMRRIVVVIAVAAAAYLALVRLPPSLAWTLDWPPPGAVPYAFPDYLGYAALFVAVIVGTRIRRPWHGAAVMALVGALILASANRTAAVALIAAAPVLYGLTATGRIRAPTAAAIIAVVPLCILAAVLAQLPGSYDILGSRARLMGMLAHVFTVQPSAILSGFGWGRFADLFQGYVFVDTASLGGPAPLVGPMTERFRIFIHSHNALVDAFIAAGVVGAALTLLIPAAYPLFARRQYLPLAAALGLGLAIIDSLWFPLACIVPFQAVAAASIAAKPTGRGPARTPAAFLLAGAAASCLWAAAVAYGAARNAEVLYAGHLDPDAGVCAEDIAVGARDGQHLAMALLARAYTLGDAQDADDLDRLLCAADRLVEAGAGVQLAAAALETRTVLTLMLTRLGGHPVRRRAIEGWEGTLAAYLRLAPGRTDAARHFLYWLLGRGDVDGVRRIAATLPEADPVRLWFEGLVLLKNPGTRDAARATLRRALAVGADRMIEIDPGLRAWLAKGK